MIVPRRAGLFALSIAVAMAFGPGAEAHSCRRQAIRVVGHWTRTLTEAQNSAREEWSAFVRRRFGSDYAAWKDATEEGFRCVETNRGVRCTAVAAPCKDVPICLGRRVNAEGFASRPFFRSIWARARSHAIRSWEHTVRDRYGSDYAVWESGRDKRFSCSTNQRREVQCRVTATPCRS